MDKPERKLVFRPFVARLADESAQAYVVGIDPTTGAELKGPYPIGLPGPINDIIALADRFEGFEGVDR